MEPWKMLELQQLHKFAMSGVGFLNFNEDLMKKNLTLNLRITAEDQHKQQ